MEWEGVQKKNAEDSKMSSVGMFFKMFSGGGGQKQIQKRTNIICKFFCFRKFVTQSKNLETWMQNKLVVSGIGKQ